MALKQIIVDLAKYVKACNFGGGQLFVTLLIIFLGGFFFVVVPLNFILGASYCLEIVDYNNFYFIIFLIIKVFFILCFVLILIIGWLNVENKKVYYFKPFYFAVIIIILFFVCVVMFIIEVLNTLPVVDGSYESSVIFNTFRLHKLVVIADSHPYFAEIKQSIQPKGADHGFYSFDVLPSNTKYTGEHSPYLSSDVDTLIDRIEKEKELNRLRLERDYHLKMVRRIGYSLTFGLWAIGWLLRLKSGN